MITRLLLFALTFLTLSTVRGAVCYSISATGNTLEVSVLPDTDYLTPPFNNWTTAQVTVSWDEALGSGVITQSSGQGGFSFAPDGAPVLESGTYYQKFGFTAPTTVSLANGTPLVVLQMMVQSSNATTGDFSIVEAPPITGGDASFTNVFGDQFANGTCTLTASNVVLPVLLHSFGATLNQSCTIATLDWEVAHEENNQFFTVERSFDYRNWEAVAKLPSDGNEQHYRYTDALNNFDQVVYRLSQTDLDGTTSFLGLRSLNNRCTSYKVVLQPNPTSGTVLLRTELIGTPYRIVNALGQVVLAGVVTQAFTDLDLSNQPGGTYTLIFDSREELPVQRITKL